MKKILITLTGSIVLAACNNNKEDNTGNTESSTDSLNHTVEDDRNNRNTTVYDSASGRQSGDTASYERLPNKISDTTPR
ncbi:MAG TPA: hypothetical protein VJU78_13800 [Chitinophagaceae bacterium]|nr:hypothetical protein [Chitinophagaceae bacterium]